MISYWEQQSFLFYDHIVIGSGIVGLQVAIHLKLAFPQQRVLVLERSLLPYGASLRNAGFACMGSATELLSDLNHQTEAEVVGLFLQRRNGLHALRSLLGDAAMDYKEEGSFELIGPEQEHALDKIDFLNALLSKELPHNAFTLANHKLADFNFNKEAVKALISNNFEGSIHTGKTLRALVDKAITLGVELKTGARVAEIHTEGNQAQLWVTDTTRAERLPFQARTVTLCTNAFTKQFLPDEDVVPGRGQVLITEPIPNLPFKGIFHMEEGYFYFRELDGRILIGGGRNKDFNTEQTTDIALNEYIQGLLDAHLQQTIIPGIPYKVAMRWAGIMAFGATKLPIVQQLNEYYFGAFRMGGMGVALGAQVAKDVVQLIIAQTK